MNSEAPGDPGALAFSYAEAAEKAREAGSKLIMVAFGGMRTKLCEKPP